MNIQNCRNVKFKGHFVLNNLEKLRKQYKFNSGVLTLIHVARRDGLKCDTCQKNHIHFELHPQFGMTMLMGKIRMTKDHDLLNSLDGSDDADNQHLLCEKCNSLRGSLFAQYKEFKDWYDSVLAKGLNPEKEINKITRNFSYIDFEKNCFNFSKFLTTIVKRDVIPQKIKKELTAHFFKHQSFKHVKGFYSIHTLLSFSDTAWDNYLNELIVSLVQFRTNKCVELGNAKFNVFKYKKSLTQIDIFLLHLNASVKVQYNKAKKKAYSTEALKFIKEQINKTETVQQHVIPVQYSLFDRIKSFFKVLVAA